MEAILDRLWLGGPELNYEYRKHHINHVIILAEDKKEFNTILASGTIKNDTSITISTFTLYDGLPNDINTYTAICQTIQKAIGTGHRVGIRCAMGRSRTPAVAIAYLIWIGFHPFAAREYVLLHYPKALIAPELWSQIRQWATEKLGYDDLHVGYFVLDE